jgi:hypothetical protein
MTNRIIILFSILISGLIAATPVFSGNPEVVDVKVECPDKSHCDFSATLRHVDEGWNHYVNRWEVLSPEGELLGTRKLLHPHVHEQPFTRSLNHVVIPGGIDRVTVRAHDSVHGYGRSEKEVSLPLR